MTNRFLILIVLIFFSCESDKKLPSVKELKDGESITILDYAGHTGIELGERTNLGAAYRFTNRSKKIILFKLDPYAENVLESSTDSVKLNKNLFFSIDKYLTYYRYNSINDGSCSAESNVEFIWKKENGILIEKYQDSSCFILEYFEDSNPLAKIINESGINTVEK